MATASVVVVILLAYTAFGSSQLVSPSVLHHIDRHVKAENSTQRCGGGGCPKPT